MAVAVRSVSVKPMRDRRRKRVEARVFDESGPAVAVWFNQPWIARQLGDGATLLLHGKLRRRGEFWVTEFEPFGRRRADAHRRAGARPPGDRGDHGVEAARADVGGLPADARLGRAAARAPARPRSACRTGRPRWRRRTSRTARRTSWARVAGSRSRSSSCSSSPWPAAAARGARAAARGRSMRAASWWTAGAGRSRSSSPMTRSGRWARSTRTSPRTARCSGC